MMGMRMGHHQPLVLLMNSLGSEDFGGGRGEIPAVEIEVAAVLLLLIGGGAVSWGRDSTREIFHWRTWVDFKWNKFDFEALKDVSFKSD